MSAPGSKVRLRAPGEEASPRLDRVTEPGPAPGDRDNARTLTQRATAAAATRHSIGSATARPLRALRWACQSCRGAGAFSQRPGARGPRPRAPGGAWPGGRRPRPPQRQQCGRAGRSRPREGGSGGKSQLGPLRGRPAARSQDSPCLRP